MSILLIDKQNTTTIVDSLTGEVIQELTEQSIQKINKKVSKEQFFMLYADILQILYGKTLNNSSPKVFWYLLDKYQGLYSDFALSKTIKDKMSEILNVTERTIYTSINELVASNLLIKTGRSTFKVNPEFVWKGSLEERGKLLQLNIYAE